MLELALVFVILVLLCVIVRLALRKPKFTYDGTILVTETDEKKLLSLEIDVPPDLLDQKQQIIFRVKKAEASEE